MVAAGTFNGLIGGVVGINQSNGNISAVFSLGTISAGSGSGNIGPVVDEKICTATSGNGGRA